MTAGPASECFRRATQERLHDEVGINFAIVISSQCCARRSTACACSLSEFFYRGRHGQESEEGKEDREGSHQEGGKEDFQEKEVVVSATERLPPLGRNPDAKRNLSKGSEMSFAAVRYRGKALQGRTFMQLANAQRPGFSFPPR
jgi:hypothetical protein